MTWLKPAGHSVSGRIVGFRVEGTGNQDPLEPAGPSQKAPGCRGEEAGSGRRRWILEEAESEGVAEKERRVVQ